jgi:hypothetical protein
LIATAIRAVAPNPRAFKSGRDFAAWLGLTPRQNSSGGKEKLGAISKQGNRYLRKLLVVGASSLLRVAKKHKGALAGWIVAPMAKKPARLVTVALGPQARPHRLGDGGHRRDIPQGELRTGVTSAKRRGMVKKSSVSEFGRRTTDVMNDKGRRTEGQEHPDSRHEHKARRNDWDQGRRTSSRPADICSASKRPDI